MIAPTRLLFATILSLAAFTATATAIIKPPDLLDPSFDPGTGPRAYLHSRVASVNSIAVQTDGKILIGGYFSEVNGVARQSFARLHPDGSLDQAFNPALPFVADESKRVAVQKDGKVVVFGVLQDPNNLGLYGAVRLNEDGSIERIFAQPQPINFLTARFRGQLLSDGKFLWISRNLQGCASFELTRMNSDGSLDPTLSNRLLCLPGYQLDAIADQPDGKLLVSGNFDRVHGALRRGIARLNVDGSLDDTFNAGTNLWTQTPVAGLNAILVQPDGKILVAASSFQPGNRPNHSLARLNADGSVDSEFSDNIVASGLADRWIGSVALDASGRILAGGGTQIVRFLPDGRLDESFDTRERNYLSGVNAIAVQADGKVLIGGYVCEECAGREGRAAIARLLDKSPSVALEFASSSGRIGEMGGEFSLTVERSGDLSGQVTVAYSVVGGTASAGIDYRLPSGELVFPPQETSRTILVSTLDDGAEEPDETVRIALSNPTAGAVLSRQSTFLLTIEDNERPGGVDAGWKGGPGICWAGCERVRLISEPDGRLLVLGHGGIYRSGINGDPDWSSWNAVSRSGIRTMSRQEDGRIVIGGEFTHIDGVPRAGLARLNSDGSLDSTFDPGAGVRPLQFQDEGTADFEPDSWSPASISSIAVQREGRILVGGDFTTVGGIPRRGLVRFFPDGSVDPTFDAALEGERNFDRMVSTVTVQPDGRIFLSGSFQKVGGLLRNGLARLNADGTVDASFSPTLDRYPLKWLALQTDGKALIYAQSSTVSGSVLRLREDGAIDDGFRVRVERLRDCCEYEPLVSAAAIQADGKICVTGSFNRLNDVPLAGLARLNPDGSLDRTFDPPSTQLNGLSITLQPEGQILVFGHGGFTRLNGASKELKLGRPFLSNSGSVRFNFSTRAGGSYALEASPDLVRWLPLRTNTATGLTLEFEDAEAVNFRNRFYRARQVSQP